MYTHMFVNRKSCYLPDMPPIQPSVDAFDKLSMSLSHEHSPTRRQMQIFSGGVSRGERALVATRLHSA